LTGLALVLILVAAFAHSAWNYLTKRAGGGVPFIWLFAGMASAMYAPVAIGVIVIQKPVLGVKNIALILTSAVIHSMYFTLLEKGYRLGDLSVVYPVARGTGPLLSVLIGVLFLGERPSALAAAGIVLMAVGIVAVTGDPRALKSPQAKQAVLVALLCGGTVAAYTVLDKVSVSVLKTPPLILDWGTNTGRFIILTPFVAGSWDKVKEQWRLHRREAAGVAFLSPFAYILVLTAMVFTPVSYLAPAREISILIGAVMGARFLSEGNVRARIVGTAAMVAGLIALSLG
jgi:drug/metabolite transporter (DMT)-like permease